VKMNSTASLADMRLSDFHQKQELIMEMRYTNVTWRIILPVYLFTTELRHTWSSL